jgi:hypothetical protein
MKSDEVKEFQEKIKDKTVSIKIRLPHLYNISTSLASYSQSEKIDPRIREGLSRIIDSITEQAISQCPEYEEYLKLLVLKTIEKKAASN